LAVFYEKLSQIYERYGFPQGSVYNLDETGCTTVHRVPKVIGHKGAHQVGQVVSRERGELITMVGIVSASGTAIPPCFIFPRVRFDRTRMMSGLKDDCLGLSHSSGWMTSQNFIHVLEHFVKHTRTTVDNKVLLILDNHESHLTVEGIDFCKANGVILLTIPPHTSNKLQPLDRTIYGPFKTFYNQACEDWMNTHPGQVLSIYDLAPLCWKAYERSATPANVKAGFQSTGIFPLDRNIFSDVDFMSSYVTDRQDNVPQEAILATNNVSSSSSCSYKSPEMIKPFPKAPRKQNPTKKGRSPGACIIATDTPEKEKIAEKKQRKAGETKKSLFCKPPPKPHEFSSDDEEMPLEKIVDDESEYSEEEDPFALKLTRIPEINDYVLVNFDKIYYVGKLTSSIDQEECFNVTYLRKSNKKKEHFVYPQVPDEALVSLSDMKTVLPDPIPCINKRNAGYVGFGISFGNLNVR